jgi:phage protein D
MPTDSGVAGAEIRVGGVKLDPDIGSKLIEARISMNLRLPDACILKFSDPELEHIDKFPIKIGSEIELLLAATDGNALTSMFKGVVVSLEPEFEHGATIVFRAYDGSHAMNQTKRAETYQNMTASDIAQKVAGRAGVTVGQIDSAGQALDFIQQSNESDWEFLWKLAARIDFEVLVIDHQLYFRKAGPPAGTQDINLKWGDGTLISFRPRITGVQQVDQVTVRARNVGNNKQPFEATVSLSEPVSAIGISRSDASKATKGGTLVVADRPVTSQAEASDLAKAVASHLASGYLEAEGVAKGNPLMKAGSKLKIDGIGSNFGGTYVVSSCTHLFQGTHGYKTIFSTAGRSSRSLVDMMTPKAQRSWANSLVVGMVTNNNDPDKLGRVRVKFPSLGDDAESSWARIASINAGSKRGVFMTPQPGDEVLVGFEHGDVHHPYVLGSLWNKQSLPDDDLTQKQDGSFSLQSDQKMVVHAKDVITIKSDKDLTVETKGKIDYKSDSGQDMTFKPGQNMTIDAAQGITIKGGTSISIEGQTSVEIKCGAAKISLSSTGTVSVSGTSVSLGS